jgi:predicted AAA+ superfamily ATPase
MKVIVKESAETLKRSRQNRLLTSADVSRALAYLKRIYHYSYTRHKEFEEMNATLNETYLTEVDFWIDQAEKNKKGKRAAAQAARLEERKEFARELILESWSTEKIAKTTKLDAAEVEALRREMTTCAG